ncbi:MAG: leucine-rich repeat protein [Muribaculaceae bacterium]|nr:leucine-rich repeat protein [Muribaculaceae bacterium]
MKTLNQTLRTILLALAFIGTTTTATAYDFMVNGIYYNINGDEATVTYEYNEYYYNSGNPYYKYYNSILGNVTIPETVTYNGKTYTVTAIGNYAFCHTNSEGISGISIPITVTSIGKYAFQDCDKLLEITIPESVTKIGDYAFYDCDYITNITIPNSVTIIGQSSFWSCSRLKTVIIGYMVSSIGSSAFGNCPLTYITCLATTPPSADGFPNSTAKLYVPLESVELYRTTSGWNYFTDVRGFGENYFSMPDYTTFHGETLVIPVSMENVDEITAFQTDLYLPNGFELLKDGDDYMVTLSDRKGRDHVIMTNDAPDGAVRILSYSPTLKTFKNNEGELFYITVKVPDDADGNYRIEFNNTILTTIDEDEVHALNAFNNIKVFAYIMGDVDASGEITVADVVQTARYILNYNPEPFIFDAADINGDGKITITDVVKIAHLVLDQDYDEPAQLMTRGNSSERMDGEMSQNEVAITLENDKEYTAFQLDLTMPEGMTASDFALAERASGLGLMVKDRGNGKMRVVGYAADLKTIKGNDGSVLTFDVAGEGEILVDGIQLVTIEGQTVRPNGFTIDKNNATTVNESVAGKTIAQVEYFNLAGQRVERPESGVTLVVTTYNDGTRSTTKVIQ